MAKTSLLGEADSKIQHIAKTVGALATIVAATGGACAWATAQVQSVITSKLEGIQVEMEKSDRKTEIQITRLELMTLIDTQPENVAEIEKVAKHYFRDLGADWYLTSIYSTWAREYGGNVNIVIGVD